MTTWSVSTAGEALIDMVRQSDGRYLPCLGGAVYNLTRALARQGTPTLYQNPFSFDTMGRRLAQGVLDDGVHLAQAEPVPEVTSLAMVGVDAHGHPDYAFYREAVADRAVSAEAMNAACARWPDLGVVCTGCLALAPQDADKYLPWLQTQKAAGRWVVVDANMRPSVMPDLAPYRAHVQRALALADLIKASDEDLAVLQVPGSDPLEQARGLLASVPAGMMALTLGAQGAVLLRKTPEGIVGVRGQESGPVQVVDTVGAGDSFLAGLLTRLIRLAQDAGCNPAGMAQRLDASQLGGLLAHATATATLNVMRAGCQPPTWDEVLARLAAHPVHPMHLG
jgi:fructokinase